MMEHPLHTISYVADIDNVLVIMAHIVPAPETVVQSPVDETCTIENKEEVVNNYTPKMTCHVLDTDNVCYSNSGFHTGGELVQRSPT